MNTTQTAATWTEQLTSHTSAIGRRAATRTSKPVAAEQPLVVVLQVGRGRTMHTGTKVNGTWLTACGAERANGPVRHVRPTVGEVTCRRCAS